MNKKSIKSTRLNYEKPCHYSNNVLLGNWYEESIGEYQKNQFKHSSVYMNDFKSNYTFDKESTDMSRNLTRINSEFADNIFLSKSNDIYPSYYENYSSTYDLAYKYFPEWMNPSTIRRIMRFRLLTYEPTDEYLNSFGNLSQRNDLLKAKRDEYECEKLNIPKSFTSNQIDFVKYDQGFYKISRQFKPSSINMKTKELLSSKICFPKMPAGQQKNNNILNRRCEKMQSNNPIPKIEN